MEKGTANRALPGTNRSYKEKQPAVKYGLTKRYISI